MFCLGEHRVPLIVGHRYALNPVYSDAKEIRETAKKQGSHNFSPHSFKTQNLDKNFHVLHLV